VSQCPPGASQLSVCPLSVSTIIRRWRKIQTRTSLRHQRRRTPQSRLALIVTVSSNSPSATLAHLGAFRLPSSTRLYSNKPDARDCPFDQEWLTLPGLVSTVWAVNILATAVTSSQISSFLLDQHQIARSMDALEGSFFPAFDPSFFQNEHVLKALKSGSFTSGHRLTSAEHLSDSITPLHFVASITSTDGGFIMPLAGLSAISAVTILGNIGWLLHCIFSDPALYPELSADTSPFLLRAPFAGLLMQAMHLMAQPRTTEASDAGARENSLRGRQNSFALLLHIGNLFQIFSDWASPLNPRAHCLVAAPQSFRARSDLSVLSASTPTGDPIHLHLAKWLTQFRGSVVWS